MANVKLVLAVTAAALLIRFVVWLLPDYARVLRLRKQLPPGPFPLPLLGNYFDMWMKRPWEHWEKLGFQYESNMITLWNGHRPVICCNDAWCISDLFEKRASIYSSRPQMIMMGDVPGTTTTNQVCLKYDDQWRLHRKLFVVANYRGFQGDETKLLLHDLLKNPDGYVLSVERYSCSIASIVGWGRRIEKTNDYVVQQALSFMEIVNAVIPGQAMMEVIPALAEWPVIFNPLPALIGWLSKRQMRFFYALTNEAVQKERAAPFASRIIKECEQGNISWREVSMLTGNLLGGGVDTTSSSIISMILAMCCFPRAQQKAYEELKTVVGTDRLPDWDGELPYVRALVEEALRWRTVTTLGGIPHAPTQDDEYQGYLIPKDTWVVGNIWAIHRHPRDFPEPDEFRPERFLDEAKPYPSKKGHNAFGWGRRQCSGQPLAEQGLYLVTARLLWAFQVLPGLDRKGNEVKLDIFDYTPSENQRPKPFKARFVPRTDKVRSLVEAAAKTAQENLSVYNGESKLTLSNAPKVN